MTIHLLNPAERTEAPWQMLRHGETSYDDIRMISRRPTSWEGRVSASAQTGVYRRWERRQDAFRQYEVSAHKGVFHKHGKIGIRFVTTVSASGCVLTSGTRASLKKIQAVLYMACNLLRLLTRKDRTQQCQDQHSMKCAAPEQEVACSRIKLSCASRGIGPDPQHRATHNNVWYRVKQELARRGEKLSFTWRSIGQDNQHRAAHNRVWFQKV